MAAGLRATAKAVEHPPEPKVGASVLDPTATPRAALLPTPQTSATMPHNDGGTGNSRRRRQRKGER
jgi:hypothetical protein